MLIFVIFPLKFDNGKVWFTLLQTCVWWIKNNSSLFEDWKYTVSNCYLDKICFFYISTIHGRNKLFHFVGVFAFIKIVLWCCFDIFLVNIEQISEIKVFTNFCHVFIVDFEQVLIVGNLHRIDRFETLVSNIKWI